MIVIGLIGAAIGANAVVFSALDGFVIKPFPFHEADRLVSIGFADGSEQGLYWPDGVSAWQGVRDLFVSVDAFSEATTGFVVVPSRASDWAGVSTVTPGLFDTLGVKPRWGRVWTSAEIDEDSVVILSEGLARRLFHSPEQALSQRVEIRGGVRSVLGVMASTFRFPSAAADAWVPVPLNRWPGPIGLSTVARLSPRVSLTEARSRIPARAAVLTGGLHPLYSSKAVRAQPVGGARRNADVDRLLALVAIAAAALLVIACANAASLELVVLDSQSRDFAVRSALGATPWALCRQRVAEGAALVVIGWLVGVGTAAAGLLFLEGWLTRAMEAMLAKPLAIDSRLLTVTVLVAGATWAVSSIPILLRTFRQDLVDQLRLDTRSATQSKSSLRLREALLASQIVLTVAMLALALGSSRHYVTELTRDRGFEAANLAAVSVRVPPGMALRPANIDAELLTRLRATPWVSSVARTSALPPSTRGGLGSAGRVMINGAEPIQERVLFHDRRVDPEYFRTMGLSSLDGRLLDSSTQAGEIVIERRLAKRYWPHSSPLDSLIRIGGGEGFGFGAPTSRVIGVVQDMLGDRTVTTIGFGEDMYDVFVVYVPFSADDYYKNRLNAVQMVVRLTDSDRLPDLATLVRDAAPGAIVNVESVSSRYERLYANERLAALTTVGFGVLSLIVAATGIFAIASSVARARLQEIAIRLCLGGSPLNIVCVVATQTLRPVILGLSLGLIAVRATTPLTRSWIPGIPPPDFAIYSGIGVILTVTVLLAVWTPLRRALNTSPMRTLRDI